MRPALCVLFLSACAGPGAPVDAAVDAGVDTGACADVPVVNWANFGEGFVLAQCQGCHAAAAADRYGAPADVTFGTVDDVWSRKDAVLDRAGAEDPTMPPDGGTTADDRTRLHWWLECAPEGT
jgi:uncharacterized membrane protein